MPYTQPFDLEPLMQKVGHIFAKPLLLKEALVHPSLSGTKGFKKGENSPYERLEFLGDRVLGLVIAQWLFEVYPKAPEGELAKRHAALVNRDALTKIASAIQLADHLKLVRGDDNSSRQNLAALSDAMEGIIGAMYLDGGLAVAERFIKKYWADEIHTEAAPADPKTALQEYAQSKGLPLPVYKVIEKSGPAHAPKFVIQVIVQGYPPVQSEGGSKREAEKEAARLLLEGIHNNDR